MFQLTAEVKFNGFKSVKPSSLKWKRDIDNYSDSCSIMLPAMCRLVDKNCDYSNVPKATGEIIKEGTKVTAMAGLDGKNDLQFMGFVKRINFKVPVEIECEGYSYQLRRKIINHNFPKTTVKEVLNFLIEGTDIRLSAKMPDSIVFEPLTVKNYTGVQLLDFLKEKYLLTVFFFFDELYVGWRATFQGDVIKHRLNWNVIKDDQLLFNTYTGSQVHFVAESRNVTGVKQKKKAQNVIKPGDEKIVKTFIQNAIDKQNAVNDKQLLENKRGYTGAITSFLKPYAKVGDTTEITDKKYKERDGGRYFIESVEGSFTSGGGRQKIGIGFSLSNHG